jgi:hypothetical protein
VIRSARCDLLFFGTHESTRFTSDMYHHVFPSSVLRARAQSAVTANGASSVLTFSNVLQRSLSVSVTAADAGASTYSLSAAYAGCPLSLWVPVQENVVAAQYAQVSALCFALLVCLGIADASDSFFLSCRAAVLMSIIQTAILMHNHPKPPS